ncbi:hypothetical protein LXT21_33695 [Myxococcus sp. K38C18041901]|uniref:hypothetical protein n=1 Tax=Myxococcus guangdongensis TaxID=2906760 RepID=UPI0020A82CBD|nr:hypothetical protein [Myxococcus guangdongensis]MCP3063740.1 hypothetical protein [Myxococcus guangdongensis]
MTSPLLLGVVLPLLATASPEPSSARWGLHWNAPSECIQAAPLARAVEARLGRSVFGSLPDVLVHGVLEPASSSGWSARLTLVDARGTVLGSRDIDSATPACADIERRLVLVLALMIDPEALSPREPAPVPSEGVAPPEEAPPLPEAPDPTVEEELPIQASSPPTRAAPWPGRSTVSLTALTTTGLSDGLAWGGRLGWRGAGSVTWLVGLSVVPWARSELEDGRVGLLLATPEAGVCPLVGGGSRWEVSACATAAFSFVMADSTGQTVDEVDLLIRGDAVARAQLELRWGGATGLHVGGGAAVGWLRPTLPMTSAWEGRLGAPWRVFVELGLVFRGP